MRHWWETRTLRFRLAAWYAVGGTVLLALFAATLYFYVASNMARPLAEPLERDLEHVRRHLTISENNELLWDGRRIGNRPPWMMGHEGVEYPWFEVWDDKGELVRRLWPFAGNRVTETPTSPPRNADRLSIFSVAKDLRLRVFSTRMPPEIGRPTWMIRMIRIHQPNAEALSLLKVIIFVALPIVIALLVLGGFWLTRRWLLPLDQMASEANKISAHDLSRRLPVANQHDELGQLAGVFNVTLDRLESSFEALDRFVTDASHELRTPLTTLRSVGEVGLRRGRTVEEYREIIGSMLEEAQRLEGLVQRLLELASAEGGSTAAMQRAPVALVECVTACVNELGILAEHKGQNLKIDAASCRVTTDPVIFRQALQNLVDNAIKYSPDNSTIRIAVANRENQVEVAVTDEGPGISAESRTHLMERFYRPDRGRDRDSGGFGLGLSITKAYMRALGGSLEYEAGNPSGSTFRLILPAT